MTTIAQSIHDLETDYTRRKAELLQRQQALEAEAASIARLGVAQQEAADVATARREASETLQTVLAAHSERWATLAADFDVLREKVGMAHTILDTLSAALSDANRAVTHAAMSLGNDAARLVPILGRGIIEQAINDLVRDSGVSLELPLDAQQRRAYHIHAYADPQGSWRIAAQQLGRG